MLPDLKTLYRGVFDHLDGDGAGLQAAREHSDAAPGVPGQHQALQLEDTGDPASCKPGKSSPKAILLVEHLSGEEEMTVGDLHDVTHLL